MSAVLVVEPECSTCGQKELDANPPRLRPRLHQSGATDKMRRGTETERRSGQEKPGVTQSERSSSPWCKGRVSLREAERRTLNLQRQRARAETCRAARRAEAARRSLSFNRRSLSHTLSRGGRGEGPTVFSRPLRRSAALMRRR